MLLLNVDITTTLAISCKASPARGLRLPICVSVLSAFLSEDYLLCVVLEKVHTGVRAAALFEINQVLRLLHKLIVAIAARLRQIVLLPLPVIARVHVLRMSHLRFARLSVVLHIARAQVLPVGRVRTRVRLLLLMLKTVIIILV